MGLSCTISEIDSDFSRKLLNFPTPCILHPRWKGSPLNWVLALWVRKLEWWGYRADKEVWRYLQPSSYNAPMWQMNGNRATAKTVLMHSIVRYLSRIPFLPLGLSHCWLGGRMEIYSVKTHVLVCCWSEPDLAGAKLVSGLLGERL